MATSPIYSWPEPDNTDLVKNGALAIRTLGNAIDTTMGTMVAKTVVDAKGDLIAGTANDTVNRLAVGNNGETLVADSSTSTGLRYTAGTVQSNPVLNSAFQIWQRGTSFTSTAETTANIADRWTAYTGSTGRTVTRQATNDTTNLPNIQYCVRYQRNSGVTNTSAQYLSNTFETINSIPYAGKTVTLSFYARAGANYSATSNALSVELRTGTGTDQNIYSGFTGTAYAVTSSATLTTTWQRFSFTGTVGATATQLAVALIASPTGTAGANDYFEVTGVQIDIGSVALPFRTYAGTIQGELSACQRYYVRFQGTGGAYTQFGLGWCYSTTQANFPILLPVQMRTSPTAVEYHSSISINYYAIANFALTALTLTTPETSPNIANIISSGSSGLTQYRVASLMINGNTAGYLAFTAEL